jgi:uncharacterized protein YbaP (TraB family)
MPFPFASSWCRRVARALSCRPMSRRPVAGLLLATLLGTPAVAAEPPSSCPPVATVPTAAQMEAGLRDARDRGFLWRLTKDGRVSYLYGTLHVGRLEWVYPGPTLARAVKEVDTIALEMDVQDPGIVRRMQAALAAAPRHPLPAALQRRIAVQVAAACVPEAVAQGLPPEFLVHLLDMMSGRPDGLQMDYGADVVLGGMARGLGKPLHSLESPELQLRLMLAKTPADSVRQVTSGLDNMEAGRSRAMMARIGSMWAEGRLDELQRYEDWCDCTRTAADRRFMARLLDGRNPALARGIDALHTSGRRVFAAVGSLHMVGAQGLPGLMAQRGYRVERVGFGARADAAAQ